MKKISTEALIGSGIILILVLIAFMWVAFKPKVQHKYHPPYKYYSGDKPDYSSRK